MDLWGTITGTVASLTGTGAEPMELAPGSPVEYYSESSGAWIPAHVVQVNADGTIDLDVRRAADASKIRPAQGGGAGFQPPGRWSAPPGVGAAPPPAYGSSMPARASLGAQPPSTAPISGLPPPAYDRSAPAPRQSPVSASMPPPNQMPASQPTPTFSTLPPQAQSQQRQSAPPAPPPAAWSQPAAGRPPGTGPQRLISSSTSGGKEHFQVHDEGARLLQSLGNRPVAAIAVCGRYRTGKSFLLNLLTGSGGGFAVGDTVNACTDGIWVHAPQVPESATEPVVLYLDCEGWGDTEKDRTHDSKLMALCHLLSCVFVYNSKGVLDENAVHDVSLAGEISKFVAKPQTTKPDGPVLYWVLRDFALELVDAGGNPITPDMYLDNALATASKDGRANETRKAIKECFPERACATLVVPVTEEHMLQNLTAVPYQQLRPQFRSTFEECKARMVQMALDRPKKVNGSQVTCSAFAGLAAQYVHAMNTSEVIRIDVSWNAVAEGACTELTQRLIMQHTTAFKQEVEASLPLGDTKLTELLTGLHDRFLNTFRTQAIGDANITAPHEEELTEHIQQLHKGAVEKNNVAAARACEGHLGPRVDDLRKRIASGQMLGRAAAQQLGKEVAQVVNDALAAGRGPWGLKLKIAHEAATQIFSEALDRAGVEHETLRKQLEALQQQHKEELTSQQTRGAQEMQKQTDLLRTLQDQVKEAATGKAEVEKQLQSLKGQVDQSAKMLEEERREADKKRKEVERLEQLRMAEKSELEAKSAEEKMAKIAEMEMALNQQKDMLAGEKEQREAELVKERAALQGSLEAQVKLKTEELARAQQRVEETEKRMEARETELVEAREFAEEELATARRLLLQREEDHEAAMEKIKEQVQNNQTAHADKVTELQRRLDETPKPGCKCTVM